MIITTEHYEKPYVPAHIRLRNVVWNHNEFERRDYTLSYYQQAKRMVDRVYKGVYASYGRVGQLGEEPENVWYSIEGE